MKTISILIILFWMMSCSNQTPPVTTGLEGKPLPSSSLLLMDSVTQFNTASIPTGKAVVLFIFSPYCPYCKLQTEELVENIKSFDSVRFYLISPSPFDQLRNFYFKYRLNKYSNITVGQDYTIDLNNYFKANAVPYFAIYDKNKYLKKVLIGKVKIDMLKDVIQE